jgi:hypothetical protein
MFDQSSRTTEGEDTKKVSIKIFVIEMILSTGAGEANDLQHLRMPTKLEHSQ